MLRLIHNQTIVNGILVDDIDDGLPNKEVHRLGSTANPKAYERDGYANKPKQPAYIPYSQGNAGFPTIPGYIDVDQTNRVTLSAGKGKIFKLSKALTNSALAGAGNFPMITVVSLTAADIAKPAISAATTSSTNFVITGTTLTSVSPDVTVVTFATGGQATTPSPAVWTQSAIITAGGTVGATSISIPMSAFTQEPVTGNTVTVDANEQNSNTFSATAVTDLPPHVTGATTVGLNFVITGTYLNSFTPATTSLTFGGTPPVPTTWTQAAILAALGTISPTSITIPSSAFSTAPVPGDTVVVHANGQNSNTFTST